MTKAAVSQKKALLAQLLNEPMQALADQCAPTWDQGGELDGILHTALASIPHGQLAYALDTLGTQISANVARHGVAREWRGQDLSTRPYLEGLLPYQGFVLSDPYLSARTGEACITAIQAVRQDDSLVGFVAVDFAVGAIPEPESGHHLPAAWQQFRGDPAIRDTLFLQTRTQSVLDQHLDTALSVVETLMRDHGVFHAKLHFSSSRLTIWHLDDPFSYALHGPDEMSRADLCLSYPRRKYPPRAIVPHESIRPVLEQFRMLRFADETLYLRSGSLNVINGMVGLNFSCDGTHYMSFSEFLARDLRFWIGDGDMGNGRDACPHSF